MWQNPEIGYGNMVEPKIWAQECGKSQDLGTGMWQNPEVGYGNMVEAKVWAQE